MTKSRVKRGLPSRFTKGEIARQHPVPLPRVGRTLNRGGPMPSPIVLLRHREHSHYRNPRWQVTYLNEFVLGWVGTHRVKESRLVKIIWTFTGYVDQPSGAV